MSTPAGDPHYNPKAHAKAMKAYAKATRPWFKKKRFIVPLAGVTLLFVGGVAAGLGESATTAPVAASDKVEAEAAPASADTVEAETSPEPKTKKAPAPAKKAKAIKVDAGTMLKEFEDNELAGDKKYEGKRVRVTGTVEKIDTELLDTDQYVLRISDGSDFAFLTVNCNDMGEDELSTLTVGQDVTALGTFEDGGDLGVELKKCKLA